MTTKNWSANVTENSDAIDLKDQIFHPENPRKIAASRMQVEELSDRQRAEPFRSEMSMQTCYWSRASENLSEKQRRAPDDANDD